MKNIILSLLIVALTISCGKKEEDSVTLDSRLYGHTWAYNNGDVHILTFNENTARYILRHAGSGDLVTNYTITPTSANSAVGFNGTVNSDWTYTVTATTLNLCIATTCYAFVH